MRQHHGLDTGGVKGKIPVSSPGFVTLALIQAAVEEQALSVDPEQMLGAGYRLAAPLKVICMK